MGIRSILKSLSSDVAAFSLTAAALLAMLPAAQAQPIPGSYGQATPEQMNAAPIPGANNQGSSPLPGMTPSFSGTTFTAQSSKYAQLPLSLFDAQARLQELRTMASTSPRPQEVLESVNRLSEWLGDMTDAHSKMANVFGKHDEMKLQAQAERASAHKFSAIRNQVQLLKATLLIQQHRFPEALPPLVDIVMAEPTTATGQSAYQKLKELGFAEEISTAETAPTSSLAGDKAADKRPK